MIADFFFNDSAVNANHTLVLHLQKVESSKMDNFFIFMSFIGGGPFYIGIGVFLFWLVPDKLNIIIFLSFFCLNACLNNTLKIIYTQGRPFLDYSDVKAIQCETGFGKPSGHSQSGILFYIFIGNYICNFLLLKKHKNNTSMLQKIVQIFIRILSYSIFIIIGLSRIYFGVHSFNQVFLGWIIGGLSTVLYFTLKDEIINILNKNKKQDVYIENAVVYIIIAYIFYLAILVLIFSLIENYTDIPMNWINQLLNKCLKKYNLIDLFIYRDFLGTSVGSAAFGFAFGLLLSRGKINERSEWAMNRNLEWWKWILRLAVIVFCGLILFGIVFYLDSYDGNIYILFLFKSHFPFFIIGFGLIYLIPRFFLCLRLETKNDFLKVKEEEFEGPNAIIKIDNPCL